jgi:TRAP-type C4-dicarboxylate transport system substrate-binding protein
MPLKSTRTENDFYFLDWVEEKSGGRVKFDRYTDALMGSMPEHLPLMKRAAIDMGPIMVARITDLPLSYLPILSIAGENDDVANEFSRILNFEHPEASAILQEEWAENGVWFLGGGMTPRASPEGMLFKGDVKSLADMKGMKVGGVGVHPYFDELGFTSVNILSTDQYEALSRGLVDGLIGVAYQFASGKEYEIADSFVMLGLYTVMGGGTFGINADTWNGLPPDIQAIFNDGIDVLFEYCRRTGDETNARDVKIIEDAGVVVRTLSQEDAMKLLKARNDGRKAEYLSLCEKAGKLKEAELMIGYCDEIMSQVMSK